MKNYFLRNSLRQIILNILTEFPIQKAKERIKITIIFIILKISIVYNRRKYASLKT